MFGLTLYIVATYHGKNVHTCSEVTRNQISLSLSSLRLNVLLLFLMLFALKEY